MAGTLRLRSAGSIQYSVVNKNGRQYQKIINIKCHKNFRYEGLDETPQSIIKRRKTDKNLKIEKVKQGPEKKKKSLKHLMSQQFGDEWETAEALKWYKEILSDENPEVGNHENDAEYEQEQECDCLENDVGMHI